VTTPAAERRRAAALAGHTGDGATARTACTDLDPAVRIAGLRSLHRLGELGDDDLRTSFVDPDAAVRVAAVELAATRDRPDIAALLDDDDPTVVEAAAWASGERAPRPPVVTRLIALSADHDDPLVREAAVAALGSLGDAAGLPAILAATRDKPAVRRRAVQMLAPFDGPEVDEAFARARTDPDRQVRDAVEDLIGPAEPAGSDTPEISGDPGP